MRRARGRQLLPESIPRIAGQPPQHGPVRRGGDARLLQDPQAVQFAGRLDDPGQHQVAEHLITAGGQAKAQHLIGARQGIKQAAHPRGGDRQRPALRRCIQAQVKLTLPGRQPLPRGRLQQLQPGIVMGRADVLDIPRAAAGRPYDLHRRRARRRPHRPHIRHGPLYNPGLERKSTQPEMRTRRSASHLPSRPPILSQVRSAPGGVAHWAGAIRSRFRARRIVEALAWMPKAGN
jgi:hypothetical protein